MSPLPEQSVYSDQDQDNPGNKEEQLDPVAMILKELKDLKTTMTNVENKLDRASNNFSEDIDAMKTDIAEMKERETSNARAIEKIENSIGAVAEDVLANKVSNDHINDKLETLDKKTSKGFDRIDRLEKEIKKIKSNDDTSGKSSVQSDRMDWFLLPNNGENTGKKTNTQVR